MPRRLPPLNALRAFDAAARHESFSRAGAELGVSHAAVSRHVRGLEQRLGVQLFRTAKPGVALTEAGRTLLRATTPAFDGIARAVEELSQGRDDRISVSAGPSFAVKWLMPRLGRFREAHPGIEVDLDATARLADIRRYECDLAIRWSEAGHEGLEEDVIANVPAYPVGAPSLAPDGLVPRDPADLLGYRLLHLDDGTMWCRWFADAGVETAPKGGTGRALGSLLALEAALSGQGLVLLSDELVRDELKSGRLIRFSERPFDYGAYFLVYLEETMRRRAVRAFRNWLLAESRPLRRAA